MLRRFNLAKVAFVTLGLALAMGLAMPLTAKALIAGSAKQAFGAVHTEVIPVHCKKHRHFHKRCRYCRREYHVCPKARSR